MGRQSARGLRRTHSMSVAAIALLTLLVVLLAGCGSPAPNPPAGLDGKNGVGPAGGLGGPGPDWNTAGTGGAEAAIDWAESFMTGGANATLGPSLSGWCLWFVSRAYGSHAGHPNEGWAWQLATSMVLHDPSNPGIAPRGSLMFFDFWVKDKTDGKLYEYGHVGISLGPNPREKASGGIAYGDGTIVSALSTVVITSHIKTDRFWGKYYRGWAWPPAYWGPLAQQATTSVTQPGSVQNAGNGCQVQCTGATCLVQCGSSGTTVQGPGNTGGSGAGNGPPPPTVTPTSPPPPPTVTPPPPPPTVTPTPPPSTHSETAGPTSGSGTFTNYTNAGGTLGQRVAPLQTIQVSCRLTGFATADGDNWWYKIASSPWNNGFYAPADNFYNGPTSVPFSSTPFVDNNVPMC